MTRRKLGSSLEPNRLSPEEQALVEAAKPQPVVLPVQDDAVSADSAKDTSQAVEIPVKQTTTSAKKPEAVSSKSKKTRTPKAARASKAKSSKTQPTNEPERETGDVVLVTDSFKLKQDIQKRLLRASFERKLTREAPYTKQAIVNEALEAWLTEQGF